MEKPTTKRAITLKIDICPISMNRLYRVYQNRLILSKPGRIFKKEMSEKIIAQLDPNFEVIKGSVKVAFIFRFKDKRKRDIDNLLKSVIDSTKNVLFEDDDQIMELHVKKVLSCERTETIIQVSQMEGEVQDLQVD